MPNLLNRIPLFRFDPDEAQRHSRRGVVYIVPETRRHLYHHGEPEVEELVFAFAANRVSGEIPLGIHHIFDIDRAIGGNHCVRLVAEHLQCYHRRTLHLLVSEVGILAEEFLVFPYCREIAETATHVDIIAHLFDDTRLGSNCAIGTFQRNLIKRVAIEAP